MARTEHGIDRSLNTAPQLLSHDRLLVDVVFTADPADAHLRVDASHGDQGARNTWSLRDSEQALTDNIRQHLGLMPTATGADPTLSADELRQISNDIASANTGPRFSNPADTRIEGPRRLDVIESPQFQADVEDSLRDGNQFTTGADPRTHPYGRLVNDGGPDFRGRSNSCLDCAVSALSSFYGTPQVSAPRFPDRLPDGSIDEQGGERHGPQRAARWLGGEWRTYESTNQSIPEQYASLHAYIASLGPGSSALVNSYWPSLDDNGNWEFDENGRPIIDGGHSTVIVFPPGASGPVWWDPQHGTTSDAPPASLYQNACSLIFIPIDASGGPHAGNVGHAGSSSGVPGEGAPNGSQIPSTADPIRLGSTGSTDAGGEGQRPGTGPGELRGQPADRSDHGALQSGTPDDRGDVRRSDSDRPTGAGLPGVPSDMEGAHRANEGDPRGDRVPGAGRISDGASGGTPGSTAVDHQQTDPQLPHGRPGNSRDVPRSDGVGGGPQSPERDLAPDRDVRVLGGDAAPATNAQASQPTKFDTDSSPNPGNPTLRTAPAEPQRSETAQTATRPADSSVGPDRMEGRPPDTSSRSDSTGRTDESAPPRGFDTASVQAAPAASFDYVDQHPIAADEPTRGPDDPLPPSDEIMGALRAHGMTPVDMASYSSSDGHYYAQRVLAGGREDGEIVFAGHGVLMRDAGTTVVPDGTYISFYVADGELLPGLNGLAVEAGIYPAGYYVETFGPEDEIPNYTLRTPDRLSIMENSSTVSEAATLAELLQPGMGHTHWAACREWRLV
ncbi:hypothetical protein IU457_27240 [Nocardia cyriacigeorgica]|nr:hypothetical protein [Nocardia cyriacigeorgica]